MVAPWSSGWGVRSSRVAACSREGRSPWVAVCSREGRSSGARTGNPAATAPAPATARSRSRPPPAPPRRPRRAPRSAGRAAAVGPVPRAGEGWLPTRGRVRRTPWSRGVRTLRRPRVRTPTRRPVRRVLARAAAVPGCPGQPAGGMPAPWSHSGAGGPEVPSRGSARFGPDVPSRRTASVATFVVRCASRAAASWRAASTGADGRNASVGDRRNSRSMAPSPRTRSCTVCGRARGSLARQLASRASRDAGTSGRPVGGVGWSSMRSASSSADRRVPGGLNGGWPTRRCHSVAPREYTSDATVIWPSPRSASGGAHGRVWFPPKRRGFLYAASRAGAADSS